MKKLLLGTWMALGAMPALAAEVPDWVMNPEYPGGIAAAECVVSSGVLSIDRQQAVATARVALAQQIEVRVKNVDKLYVERISQGTDKPQVKTTFERASEQLTDRVLNNSRVVKTEITKDNQLCLMVALTPEGTREYFKELVKVADNPMTPELENELFESFRVRNAGPARKQS